MFQAALETKLKAIFDIPKVEFGLMGDAREQKCLFVEIDRSRNVIKEGIQRSRVTGRLVMNAQAGALPYGYFSKCIERADKDLKRDFFFFDLEENVLTFRDNVQRSLAFVFFFVGQYDPEAGTITSINLQTQVTE
jgi:hypothetical protein